MSDWGLHTHEPCSACLGKIAGRADLKEQYDAILAERDGLRLERDEANAILELSQSAAKKLETAWADAQGKRVAADREREAAEAERDALRERMDGLRRAAAYAITLYHEWVHWPKQGNRGSYADCTEKACTEVAERVLAVSSVQEGK